MISEMTMPEAQARMSSGISDELKQCPGTKGNGRGERKVEGKEGNLQFGATILDGCLANWVLVAIGSRGHGRKGSKS
jgi:hypothetical protein